MGFRTILLILLALLLILIEVHVHKAKFIRSGLINIAAPLQHAVSWPNTFVSSIRNKITSEQKLREENAKLHNQNLLLQVEAQKLQALEGENIRLLGLIKSAEPNKDKFLIARILAVNASNLNQQIILDKGKQANVYLGQPLLDAYGLAGQVISVGLRTSVALLITDVMSAIPVEISRNGFRAIAVGNGSSLELTQAPETSDVKVGDLLVTSGLGERFPRGYPVGTVKSVEHVPGERFLKINVLPKAHVNEGQEFLLVWPKNYY